MLVAIITDTHWCARKSSKLFQDHFELFYKNIFFPTLEYYNVNTVIHMGDAFDSRKSIDFSGLEWTRRVVLEPLSNYDVHMITGNHDCYLKNSNSINSPELLLQDYKNIKTYSDPTEIKIGNLDLLLIPWINGENEEKTLKMIQNSKCKVAAGHLELNGFPPYKGHIMEDGRNPNIFHNFKKVFSGHYHTRSSNDNIHYLGNPYEIYWNDVYDERGFTIFDTETLDHYFIDNPHNIFEIVYYGEDTTPIKRYNYQNKIVKVIVRKKDNQLDFEKFLDKLYSQNPAEIKIVENFQLQQLESFESLETEDTFSLLKRYVDESECDLNKSTITNIFEEVYKEALELV
jgi:predicted phosphodiesterase